MQQKEIGWKTSFVLFSFYLCFLIFLTSCETGRDSGIPDFEDDTSEHSPGDISKNLVARIYFDATLSMQGYVVHGSTRYTQMCRYLESVIVSGWTDGKAEFFRFGEQVESIDRNTYLRVGYTDFYGDRNINRETFIQKIIDHENQLVSDGMDESSIPEESAEINVPSEVVNNSKKEKPLVVIVTDLFQDKRDITVLVSQLKEQYIQKDFEVGLLGLRSEFDGTVYDLGGCPLPYSSTPDNPDTYRPFYLLVLGRHADIAHYFDRLIATGFSDATDDVNTVIFSRYLVNPLLSFADAEIKTENLNSKTINRDHIKNPRLKQYEIVDNTKTARITAAELTYNPLRHAMFFDSNTFEASIVAEHKPDPEGKNEISLDAQRCLEVTSSHSKNDDSNGLSVEFSLDSQSLPNNRIYLYEVTLRPGIDTFKEPDWCSDWDMGDERNGARTLNLVNFVRDLTQVTARMHHPIIAKFHFYIEKR